MTLQYLLHLQWEASPAKSWLGQLISDIRHVAMYCTGAKALLGERCPLTALFDAMISDRSWWKRQIASAIRQCGKDLELWHRARQANLAQPVPVIDLVDHAYECPFCPSSFPLRKHLSVHLARRHGLFAPARLYTHHHTCVVCLRTSQSIPQAQAHLRVSKPCLRRTWELLPPLDLCALRAVEAQDVGVKKKVKAGNWQQYRLTVPARQAHGPQQPTRAELRAFLQEDAPLTLLKDDLGDETVRQWALREISFTTAEPARQETTSFWGRRIQPTGTADCRF